MKSGEIIAAMLLSWHNLAYYQRLMSELRQAIAQSRVTDWSLFIVLIGIRRLKENLVLPRQCIVFMGKYTFCCVPDSVLRQLCSSWEPPCFLRYAGHGKRDFAVANC